MTCLLPLCYLRRCRVVKGISFMSSCGAALLLGVGQGCAQVCLARHPHGRHWHSGRPIHLLRSLGRVPSRRSSRVKPPPPSTKPLPPPPPPQCRRRARSAWAPLAQRGCRPRPRPPALCPGARRRSSNDRAGRQGAWRHAREAVARLV